LILNPNFDKRKSLISSKILIVLDLCPLNPSIKLLA
jgi:hypothetical protein